MYGWNGNRSGGDMHIMGGNRNRPFGQGIGGGIGGGRVMGPLRQAFRQQYPGDRQGMRTALQGYVTSQPFQSWMSSRPQRPAGGYADPQARQTAWSGWFNQMPAYPWGAEPADWTPPQAPPAGSDVPSHGQYGNILSQLYGYLQANQNQMPGGFRPNWLQMLSRRFG